MALYYLPLLIRSDRYFVARLEQDARVLTGRDPISGADFNFVVHQRTAYSRPCSPLKTLPRSY